MEPTKAKYEFFEYRKRSSFLSRLDVFPFITLYLVQISVAIAAILSLSENITHRDILDLLVYLITSLRSINLGQEVEGKNSTIGDYFNVTTNETSQFSPSLPNLDSESARISDELQLIIDNIPVKHLVILILTFLLNIFIFLMTHWNLAFKVYVCFRKIKQVGKRSARGSKLNPKTTHILVKSTKFPSEMCPLKYSICVDNIAKLRKMNSISKIKSVSIQKMNGLLIIQVDASDYLKYSPDIEQCIGVHSSLNNKSNCISKWIKLVIFHKRTFIYNEELGVFEKANFPVNLKMKSYLDRLLLEGGLSQAQITHGNNVFGINNYEIPREKFMDLFIEQIMSPFFLFQIFCVFLWILDEYWQMSLFTLFMLCTLEAQMVFRRLKESDELRSMRRPSCQILVFRDNTWKYVATDHLLPGDIFAISSSSSSDLDPKGAGQGNHSQHQDAACISPCDFVLLSGNVTVNEAMLTGECTPKIKVCLNYCDDIAEKSFNMDEFKNHIVFAGTNIILTRSTSSFEGNGKNGIHCVIKQVSNDYYYTHSTNSCKYSNFGDSKVKDSPVTCIKYDNEDMICIGYVLKTGFNTYQGKLIKTISSSSEKVSSNSLESLLFLLMLIFCSLIASAYVLYNGLTDPSRNKFKLVLSCIHIITSVIPPEFPITLSIAVTMSVVQLTKKRIYCTEPFRIPFAGKLHICAFDKTGTLTSDKMIPHGLFGINVYNQDKASCVKFEDLNQKDSLKEDSRMESCSSVPYLSDLIMGCCNSLSLNKKILVGDPMEKSIKRVSSWRINNSSENIYSNIRDNSKFNIIKRYPFSPEEQRMTNVGILTIENNANFKENGSLKYPKTLSKPEKNSSSGSYGLVISKGSPEIMLQFFKDVDHNLYKQLVHECTIKGYRILALGSKYCPVNVISKNNTQLKREYFEQDLVFCGFLALYCPIKKHSKSVIEALNSSGHNSIMVTGDNILTAYHVARNVSIVDEDKKVDLIILSKSQEEEEDASQVPREGETCSKYCWKQSDGTILRKLEPKGNNKENIRELSKLSRKYNIGITGDVFQSLIDDFKETEFLNQFLLESKIYARMSPKNKQTLIDLYNSMGKMTLMCGDGTNDVGALKHSNVGVSLLSDELEDKEGAQQNNKASKEKKKSFLEVKREIDARIKRGERLTKSQIQGEIMKELHGFEDDSVMPKVKLGDASIASPFTYKGDSPTCILKLIRFGRSTLVTVLLMYKLMGLNSIVSAFAMSVLAYDGVKFGDFQTTVESIIMSGLFFLVLRNKPNKELVPQKPPNSIFSAMVFLSFSIQATIHLLTTISITLKIWMVPLRLILSIQQCTTCTQLVI
ncbi:manganese-transporting ATPase 13A1-like [Cryptosporidium felis]|nr:manganese-transporting ATPase 13A1-like [Cryptosporidium felis]